MEELIEIIKKYVPNIELNENLELIEDGLIDSIQLVEIIIDISEKFQVDISGDDIDPDNFQSIQSIWNLILKLKNK